MQHVHLKKYVRLLQKLTEGVDAFLSLKPRSSSGFFYFYLTWLGPAIKNNYRNLPLSL
jgi:hypothetical protein